MVSAPELIGPQALTVTSECCPVSVMRAMFVEETQPVWGTLTVRDGVNVLLFGSVVEPVSVPSVVGPPPLKVSVTVIVPLVMLVGFPNPYPAEPCADAPGVDAPLQLAVA